jgi:hypothetical protein
VRRVRILVIAFAVITGFVGPAYPQPYAWVPLREFRGFSVPPASVLRVVNLGTTHVESLDLPNGLAFGQGALDPVTGHYFLITNAGTGEVEPNPPRLLPVVKPWRGNALYLSPDGAYAYVCDQAALGRTCQLVRRSDDQVLGSRTGVLDIAFDQSGAHVLTVEGTDTRTIESFAPGAPTVARWSRSYTRSAEQRPRVAVSANRIFTASNLPGGTTLEAIDAATGGVVHSAIVADPAVMLAAGGGRVFALTPSSSLAAGRLTSYSADTLTMLAQATVGSTSPLSSVPVGLNVIGSGEAVALQLWLRNITSFRLFDAATLQSQSGGGVAGVGTQSDPAYSSEPLCRVAVSPLHVDLPAGGGYATFTVTPEAGCNLWPASPGAEGYRLIGPDARTGAAQVIYAAAQNLAVGYSLRHEPPIAGTRVVIGVAPLVTVPEAPTIAAVGVSGTVATISWEAATSGAIPSSFAIEGGPAGGPVVARLTAAKTARSIATGPLPAGDYFVQVRARNAAGEGLPSGPVRFSVGAATPPGAPTAITADVQGSVVRVAWTAAAAGAAAERFSVEARPAQPPGGAFFPIGRAAAGESAIALVVPPAFHGAYVVRVRALNAAGSSAPSADVSVAPSACVAPPQAPAAFDAMVTGPLAELRWTASVGGAERYVVEVGSESGEANLGSFTTDGPILGWKVEAPVTAYFVRVRGQNGCGIGPASPERVVFVLWELPYVAGRRP